MTKQNRRLSDREMAQIRVAYEAGATSIELSAKFGVTEQTVYRRLRAIGVRMRGSALTAEETAQAVTLYATGLLAARTAERLGPTVSPDSVRLALIRVGVAMRDTQGRER